MEKKTKITLGIIFLITLFIFIGVLIWNESNKKDSEPKAPKTCAQGESC